MADSDDKAFCVGFIIAMAGCAYGGFRIWEIETSIPSDEATKAKTTCTQISNNGTQAQTVTSCTCITFQQAAAKQSQEKETAKQKTVATPKP